MTDYSVAARDTRAVAAAWPHRSRGRKTMLALVLASAALAGTAAGIEVATRVALALRTDRSVLMYGTRWYHPTDAAAGAMPARTAQRRWDDIVSTDDIGIKRFVDGPYGTFSQYVPRSTQTMPLADGEPYTVTHNNFGFRGADFVRLKAPGVVRVITLGASSTFGYLDRDDETYPHYLEEVLNRRLGRDCSGVTRFEVLNFGIPHLSSDNIRALFFTDALGFDPDVVTFYEGANDTRRIRRPWAQRVLLSLSPYSLTVLLVSHLFETELETFAASDVAAHLAGKPAAFVANVAAIARECARRHIRFVVSTQQVRSFTIRDNHISEFGYAQEVDIVRARLASGARLNLGQLQLLIHSKLMAALRAWAIAQPPDAVRFVDFIQLLERAGKRREVRSWVHLSADGNRVLAGALADQIYPAVCRSTPGAAAAR